MRSITGPLVQLGLDLPYPLLRLRQRMLRRVGIHRRPPGLPASLLPTRWPPSPCGRLSRPPWRVVTPATTTGPPSRPAPTADDAPARPHAGCARRERHRTVPTFTTRPLDGVGAQLCPCGIATATPWTFTVASCRKAVSRLGVPDRHVGRCAPQPSPYPPALSWWVGQEALPAGFSRTPFHLASRTHAVWQCQHVPALSGLLPPSQASPWSGCPQLHPAATTARR
jgi:hypothetical protein